MSQAKLHVPQRLRRGAELREEASIDEAAWLIEHMCQHLGLEDLATSDVLDFGCGVKFTQALINRELPVRRYVGVDVNSEVIDYLSANVVDPRFDFHRLNAHNELYNPEGEPLSEDMTLPIPSESFDVICLFSVFTHLAPHDYRAMLRLLRRFARPSALLFYTLFINEPTPAGHGLIDFLARRASEAGVDRPTTEDQGTPGVPDFVDMNPRDPLRWAVYSPTYALELIEGTGWHVESVSPPDVKLQHHVVCSRTPAESR
jgi:SAM-dependent methyltransferase